MCCPNYNSARALAQFLTERGLRMHKKWGQNFLLDPVLRTQLVKILAPERGERVWEIGAGIGAMTALLVQNSDFLTVFEIDRGFVQTLRKLFDAHVRVIEGDVLQQWHAAAAQEQPACVLGNLPYNIAARFIGNTIESGYIFKRMVVTIQKEIGLRMTALPAQKWYSYFSVLCQWQYEVRVIRNVAPVCFWPRPHVVSQALVLTKRNAVPSCVDPALFLHVTKTLFSARRKTVRNNLLTWQKRMPGGAAVCVEELCARAGIDARARAEQLSIYDFITLSDTLRALL